MNQILSEQFVIKWRDFFKGLVLGVGTPVLYWLQEFIPTWDAAPVLKIAIAALITYLLKNFFAPTVVVDTKPSDDKIASLKK